MKLFFSLCRCFKKEIIIYDKKYSVICGEKYTEDGEIYLGKIRDNNDMYPDDLDPDICIKSFLCIPNKKEKIMKYNINNNDIRIYDSIYLIAKDLKLEPNVIRNMSKNKIIFNNEYIIKCFYI
jgi:hypothetical protein